MDDQKDEGLCSLTDGAGGATGGVSLPITVIMGGHAHRCMDDVKSVHLMMLAVQVVSRMESSDHWITYCEVQDGAVLDTKARTAVHTRKVASYY